MQQSDIFGGALHSTVVIVTGNFLKLKLAYVELGHFREKKAITLCQVHLAEIRNALLQ